MSTPPIVLLSDCRIKHYAGSVTYSVEGFVAKNSDLLERDLSAVRIHNDKKNTTMVITDDNNKQKQKNNNNNKNSDLLERDLSAVMIRSQ